MMRKEVWGGSSIRLEQESHKLQVVGSSPTRPTIFLYNSEKEKSSMKQYFDDDDINFYKLTCGIGICTIIFLAIVL